MSRASVIISVVLASVLGAIVWTQTNSAQEPNREAKTAESIPTSKVIHIHHHQFVSPSSAYGHFQSRDIMQSNQYYHPSYVVGETNWGNLGAFGYVGERDNNSGFFVTRVKPNSPASKLGLVVGDVVLAINGTAVESIKELERLLVGVTSQKEAKVVMNVWNSQTRRRSTLQATLVGDYSDN